MSDDRLNEIRERFTAARTSRSAQQDFDAHSHSDMEYLLGAAGALGDLGQRRAGEAAHLPTPVLSPEERRAGSRTIELTKIDFDSFDMRFGKVRVLHRPGSPWVEIEVPDGAVCVWATTGAVHPVTAIGAVTDDPVRLPWPND